MLQAADLTLDDFPSSRAATRSSTRPVPTSSERSTRLLRGRRRRASRPTRSAATCANLGEYDIADRIGELAEAGARIAREVADEIRHRRPQPRCVLGSVGPGTKLPTLGPRRRTRRCATRTRGALGMLDGGADAILVETCQDLLQTKAAVLGAKRAMDAAGRHIPVIAHVTVETTGTMLLGSEIGAALTALEPLGIDMIGLNCATGPAEMSEHLRYLSQHARIPVSVMPNAGLPVLGANGAEYPLQPDEFAEALAGFVTDYGLSLVGGCCGTTPEHIRKVAEAIPGCSEPSGTSRYEPGGGIAVLVGAVPPGRLGADDRRADERQRLQGVSRGDDRRGLAEAASTSPRTRPATARICWTCASTTSAATASPT